MASVIQLINVNKNYKTEGDDEIQVLKDISLNIESGEFVAITGPSGSGKSTLMHIIGLLDKPSSGEIKIDSETIESFTPTKLAKIRNIKIGFVFQSFNLLKKTSALDNVALPLVYANVSSKDRLIKAKHELELVGLSDKLTNTPAQLSGGQQQRVAIARALVNEPSLILADEPTGNLDSKSGEQILELFTELNNKGKTIILVTHDQKVAKASKRIVSIMDGRILSDEINKPFFQKGL
jgi:putative ABC transport system ATP-binding protein